MSHLPLTIERLREVRDHKHTLIMDVEEIRSMAREVMLLRRFTKVRHKFRAQAKPKPLTLEEFKRQMRNFSMRKFMKDLHTRKASVLELRQEDQDVVLNGSEP